MSGPVLLVHWLLTMSYSMSVLVAMAGPVQPGTDLLLSQPP